MKDTNQFNKIKIISKIKIKTMIKINYKMRHLFIIKKKLLDSNKLFQMKFREIIKDRTY